LIERRLKMNGKENVKNAEINLQAEALTDLPVADEQADETKGGPGGPGTRDAHWRESLFGNELMTP
jgi:hypothetical protein